MKRIEAEEEIKKLLEAQVMKPLVHVNLVDAKVTVLGEVKNPGLVKMDRGRLTIFEALAAVGDLTPYGRRENVLLTREVDGKLEMARLDLRDVNTSKPSLSLMTRCSRMKLKFSSSSHI